MQAYLTIVARILILIHTGGQPTKRAHEMICITTAHASGGSFNLRITFIGSKR